MNIKAVPHNLRHTTLLPGNRHFTSRPGGSEVSGAATYRIAMTIVIPAEPSAARADLETRQLLPGHVRPGPYGLVLVEAQECAVMLVTDQDEVEEIRGGTRGLNLGPGTVAYGHWPQRHDESWGDIIPASTWFPGGCGVLGEYDGVDGAKVTLYEFMIDRGQVFDRRGDATGEMVSMVGWHCDRCHRPYDTEWDERWENNHPHDRWWASAHARRHAAGRKCQPPTGDMERVVSQVASRIRGVTVELPEPAAACAAGEGCSRVRLARVTTARLLAGQQTS